MEFPQKPLSIRQQVIFTGLLMLALFAVYEVSLFVYGTLPLVQAGLKLVLSAIAVVTCFFGYRSHRTYFTEFLLIALAVFLVADTVIALHFIAGTIVFAAGHLLLTILYLQKCRPTKRDILIWALFTGVMTAALLLIRPAAGSVYTSLPLRILAICYLAVMAAMVISARRVSRWVFVGSLLFGISDVLLIINLAMGWSEVIGAVSLAVYYTGITFIAYANRAALPGDDTLHRE